MCRVENDKRERACHLVSEPKLDLVNAKMRKEVVIGSPVAKHSCRTKVETIMVKTKKVAIKKACEAKKLAKLAMVAKLSSTKKLPMMPKGKREETSRPFNP